MCNKIQASFNFGTRLSQNTTSSMVAQDSLCLCRLWRNNFDSFQMQTLVQTEVKHFQRLHNSLEVWIWFQSCQQPNSLSRSWRQRNRLYLSPWRKCRKSPHPRNYLHSRYSLANPSRKSVALSCPSCTKSWWTRVVYHSSTNQASVLEHRLSFGLNRNKR